MARELQQQIDLAVNKAFAKPRATGDLEQARVRADMERLLRQGLSPDEAQTQALALALARDPEFVARAARPVRPPRVWSPDMPSRR